MPYIQNASTTEYYNLSGIAYMSPGAIIWVSQVLYDNSAVIINALDVGSIVVATGISAPSPDEIPHQFETEFRMSIRSGATATSLQLQFMESLGGFEDSEGDLYDAGDTFISFRVELVSDGVYLLWEGLQGEDPGDGSITLTLTNNEKFQSGQSFPATLGSGGGEYDLTTAVLDDFIVTAEVSGGGGSGQIQQVITVAKSGGDFTSIQDAIDSISDAASDKQYVIQLSPGEYTEDLVLGDFIHIWGLVENNYLVAIDSQYSMSTVISGNITLAASALSSLSNVTIQSGSIILDSNLKYLILSHCGFLDTQIDITNGHLELYDCHAVAPDGDFIDLTLGSVRIRGGAYKMLDSSGYVVDCDGGTLYVDKAYMNHESADGTVDIEGTGYIFHCNLSIAPSGAGTIYQNGNIIDDQYLQNNIENVLTVAKSGMYTSIQDAIDAASPTVHSGQAQAGGNDLIFLAADASAVDDYYNGMKIRLTGGTGSGQIRTIIDYDGGSQIATVTPDWSVNPTVSTTYEVKSIVTVQVYPGAYNEAITLKDCVDVVAVDPASTLIFQGVTDNNVPCLCFLRIKLHSTLTTSNANSKVSYDENVLSMVKTGSAVAIVGGDVSGNARGHNALDIQSSRTAVTQVASGTSSVAIGRKNTASNTGSVAAGYNNTVESTGVGIGKNNATSIGDECIAVGNSNTSSGGYSSALGSYNTASGSYSSAIGRGTTASASASNAFGYNAHSRVQYTTNICGPQINRKDDGEGADAAFRSFCGVEVVLMSKEVDLKAVVDQTITLPTGCKFWIDEIGLIATSINTLTVQPTIRFGITGNLAKHNAAAITTAITATGKREIETPLVPEDGETSLTAGVTVAAIATTALGRFYWKGVLCEDE